MAAKKRKPESATCYAIRKGRKWWTGDLNFQSFGTFARAFFLTDRPIETSGCETVPCRVRPLPSVKRNRTRTR